MVAPEHVPYDDDRITLTMMSSLVYVTTWDASPMASCPREEGTHHEGEDT